MIRLRYQNGGSSAVTELFRELSLVVLPETQRVSKITLRGRRVDHNLYSHRIFQLAITTESDANDVMWITDWWAADVRFIQYPYNASDAVNWIEVSTEGGRCPITFVDGVDLFPEATLTLFEKEPS